MDKNLIPREFYYEVEVPAHKVIKRIVRKDFFRGNLADNLYLREYELHYYWIRATIKELDEATGEYIENKIVKAISAKQWELCMEYNSYNYPETFYECLGWESYELLHDPTLTEDFNELRIS